MLLGDRKDRVDTMFAIGRTTLRRVDSCSPHSLRIAFLAILVVLLAPCAAQAQAGQLREIPPSGTINSTIGTDDPVSNGRHYEDYRLPLAEGEIVQVDMAAVPPGTSAAEGLDSYLSVIQPGERSESLLVNDDREDGVLDARLYFTARVAGNYVVRAQGTNGETGNYVLTVRRLPRAPEPLPLHNDRAEGDIGDDSGLETDLSARALRYDSFWFEGTADERVRLDVGSTGFDSRLQLLSGRGVLAVGFPSGTNRDSRLFAVLPSTGRYVVRVQAPVTQAGHYSLGLTRAMASPVEAAVKRIRAGETADGSLTLASPARISGEDGRIEFFYQLYMMRVEAGRVFTVTVDSSDFDPVLDAGGMSALGFATASSNDDSDGTLNSRLVVRAVAPGAIYLRIRSLGYGTGDFTLTVARGEVPRARPQQPPASPN